MPPEQGVSEPFELRWHITSRLREGIGTDNKQVPTHGAQQISAALGDGAEKMQGVHPLQEENVLWVIAGPEYSVAVSKAAELPVGRSIPVPATSLSSIFLAVTASNCCLWVYVLQEAQNWWQKFSKGGHPQISLRPVPWAGALAKPRTRQLAPRKGKTILWLSSCGQCIYKYRGHSSQ